jgi:outer membrane protein assembly factor BamD
MSYLDNAKHDYDAAMALFNKDDYEDAIKAFDDVRTKYPYASFAALADLRIADVHKKQEEWVLAADAYDLFVKLHPRHEQVNYAMFEVARCHYKAIPTSYFFMPPGHVKDQTEAQSALVAIDRYLNAFPGDANAKEAQKMKLDVMDQLAAHDMSVAQFYARRRKWQGAIDRYGSVIQLYPSTKSAAEALFESAEILERHLDKRQEAEEFYNKLLEEYPDSEFAKKVRAKRKP